MKLLSEITWNLYVKNIFYWKDKEETEQNQIVGKTF